MPEAASQSLAVLFCVRRQDPSAVRTKRPVPDTCNLGIAQGGDQLARGRIPEPGGCVRASREDPSTIRTERRIVDPCWMVKGNDQLARSRIPELGGFVEACRQDPSTVRTERRVLERYPDRGLDRSPLWTKEARCLPETASQSSAL